MVKGMEPDEICNYHNGALGTHDLPAQFATWLHGRYRKGVEGNYRLAGFSKNLNQTFQKRNRIYRDTGRRYEPADSSIQITSPVHGEIFILNPNKDAYETELDASSSQPLPEITWYVDGREYDKVGPPYKTRWRFSRGTHTLTAVGPGHSGDSVDIEVR